MSRRYGTHAVPRLALLFLLILSIWPHQVVAQPIPETPSYRVAVPEDGAFMPGRVLVRWQQDSTKQLRSRILSGEGLTPLRTLDPLPVSLIAVPPGQELSTIARLEQNPQVASAEPDYLAYAIDGEQATDESLAAPGYQPNDLGWFEQWAPRRVQAPMAWEISRGSRQVFIAVVDSGIDLNHPEFAGRLMQGYDYVNSDSYPQDDNGHGTHISGIMAATGDNDLGVAGMAWNVRILPLKVLNSSGGGLASDVALGVLNATQQKAAVINLSLALTGPSATVHDAILMAYSSGSVIVGATGNTAGSVSYPAAYPEVIAVAATTHWDDWAGYSNSGPQVDIAAPGGIEPDQILSTSLGGYGRNYGTSMAAAHVAGLVALMRSLDIQASNSFIANALRTSTDKVGSTPYVGGRNDRLGHGRVNAEKALHYMLPPELKFAPPGLELMVPADDTAADGKIEFENPSGQPLSWQITEISQDWLEVNLPWSGSLAYPAKATLQVRVKPGLPVGFHRSTIRLRATDQLAQELNYILTVQVRVVAQMQRTFLPVIESERLSVNWIDASATGISIRLGNDDAQAIGLPFTFPFYGRGYQQVWIHANGFLSFDGSYAGSLYANNGCIPSIAPPNAAIYALWDDLDPGAGGQVYFTTTEDSNLVIEWHDIPRREGGGRNTFQVVLSPEGQVNLQYLAVAVPNGATVGLENWDATLGWQVACNGGGSPPTNGSAGRYSTVR